MKRTVAKSTLAMLLLAFIITAAAVGVGLITDSAVAGVVSAPVVALLVKLDDERIRRSRR